MKNQDEGCHGQTQNASFTLHLVLDSSFNRFIDCSCLLAAYNNINSAIGLYMAMEHWKCVQHTFLNACVCIQVNQHHIFYDLTAKVQTQFALALISLSAGEPCTGYKSAHAQNASLFSATIT